MSKYKDYERSQGWEGCPFGYFSPRDADYFRLEIGSLLNLMNRDEPRRILELGFGNGAFMGWCADNNICCDGVELNEVQIKKAQGLGFRVGSSIESLADTGTALCYDLIVAFDVIEHIHRDDIVEFFKGLQSVLTRDGVIVLRCPNGDNPFSLWMQNGDVTHQTWVGSGLIVQVANQVGLEVVRISEPAVALAEMEIFDRLKVKSGLMARRFIGKFIKVVFMGGASRVVFSPNILAVLAKR